ncbi:MAG: UDP-N-acetylmuramate dehydrogenase [Kangiellaceae bacterium]|nr:UDP-N-acetylmuramate dehydrogenase [Kangiellaceae bacterium]
MAEISSNISLRQLNTFRVKANAASFLQINDVAELDARAHELACSNQRFVLGGGSNLLFIGDYPGLVLFPQLFGKQILEQNEKTVKLRIAASENWHEFVKYCLNEGYFGLENLALIPGTVGAAPVQNIGAYGVEVEQFINHIECFDLENGQKLTLTKNQCEFAYRDSFIKRAGQGRYLVTHVVFDLCKTPKPVLTYKPLKNAFQSLSKVSPIDVFEEVCRIRREKLPDPKELPNAGSFFKNPVVTEAKYHQLISKHPSLVGFPVDSLKLKLYKIAAGWLIDNAGFKGMMTGKIGVHKHQALVIVNYSDTNGENIWNLAKTIIDKIQHIYGIELEPEVRILGR